MDVTSQSWFFTSLPYGTCLVDREGKILELNPALERLLGWRLDECQGVPLARYLEEIADPAQALAWVVALSKALSTGETTFLNVPAQLPVGKSLSRRVSVIGVAGPWKRPDGRRGAMILLHDSERSESVEGARLRFLSMIAHERNTPVNNIAYATSQMDQYLAHDAAPAGRLLRIVCAEVARMQRLLGSLFTKEPAAGEQRTWNPEPVHLPPILHQVAEFCSGAAATFPISVDVPSNLPPVLADPDAIQRAIGSLVDDMIAYASPGSRIVFDTEGRNQDVLVRVHRYGPDLPGYAQADASPIAPGDCCFCFSLPLAPNQGERDHG